MRIPLLLFNLLELLDHHQRNGDHCRYNGERTLELFQIEPRHSLQLPFTTRRRPPSLYLRSRRERSDAAGEKMDYLAANRLKTPELIRWRGTCGPTTLTIRLMGALDGGRQAWSLHA